MTPLVLALVLAAPPAVEPPAAEFGRMLAAILAGSQMEPGEGWFGPAKKRHDWSWLAKVHGIPADGSITKSKFRGPPSAFVALDRDGNNHLTADDLDWSDDSLYARQMGLVQRLLRQADGNKSGKLEASEWTALFDKRATEGELTPEGLRRVLFPPTAPVKPSGFSNPFDAPSKWTLLKGLVKSEIGSGHPGPRIGDPAPDFTLSSPDGKRSVTLSKLIGRKPVVLVFGNFSCGPYRSQYEGVEKLKEKYFSRAEFLGVYVREAHPTDGWRMMSNDLKGVRVAQPRTLDERSKVADKCSTTLKMTMPLVVDRLDDRVGHAYSGMPSRLYLIDRAGKVAYQSGRGPFGFKPAELEQALHLLTLEEQLAANDAEAESADPLPLLSAEAAWKALPDGENKTGPLPGWARMLANPLPRTTAAMLQLEQAVRLNMPLDPKLRAKVRWAAAQASGSKYGESAALADLKRAGGTPAEVEALTGDWAKLSAGEQTTMRFARKLTKMGSSVEDHEFEAVRKLHGNAAAVGIVLLVAYSNFQDRLVLSLGTPAADGAIPVSSVKFTMPYAGREAALRVLPTTPPPGPPEQLSDPKWLEVGAESLRRSMEAQTERPGRVPVPSFEDVKKLLPPNAYPPGREVKIKWSLTVIGYQPTVGQAWINCLRTFGAESKQDRKYEESLFWIVTRSVDCFY